MSKGQEIGIQGDGKGPFFNLLSDQPLRSSDWQSAAFGINEKLKPLLNTILLESTQTPLAVMVTGGWGTGKTSAMKCLEGALKANEEVKPAFTGALKADVCWFYPWKYQNKEDVWRGLIAEIVAVAHSKSWERTKRHPLDISDGKGYLTLWKGLGTLGKAVLESIELEAGADFAKIKSKLGEALSKAGEDVFHPEAAYLNSFEEALTSLIKAYYPQPGRRMVVLIDDLDRCMPPVALQVLEALKLYLNIPGLIFVAGVDKDILNLHIEKSYCDMVREQARTDDFTKKTRLYLDKMFQATLNIEPQEIDVEKFLDQLLKRSPFWLGLDGQERAAYRRAISDLGSKTPRSIVRLFNRVLLAGAKDLKAVSQGIQSELISAVCEEVNPSLAGIQQQSRGKEFLILWSRILRESDSNTIFLPEAERRARRKDITKEEMKTASDQRLSRALPEPRPTAEERQEPDTDFDHLQPLMALKFRHYERLLGSLELALLLKIPYPGSEVLTPLVSPDVPSEEEVEVLRRWIAGAKGQDPSKLSTDLVLSTTHLEIKDEACSDLSPVRWLTSLQELYCGGTQVSDLSPLSGLTSLRSLDCNYTLVSDLSPLSGLTSLREVYCSYTSVSDLSPLSGLTNLQALHCSGLRVSDLSPLSGLTSLQKLGCWSTPISDLSPLSGLTSLQEFYCYNTQISDLSPIKGLVNLQQISCYNTAVKDLLPLIKLQDLTDLDCGGIEIHSLLPIAGLPKLEVLRFPRTKITEITPLATLGNLKVVDCRSTQVSDLSPLAGLTSLIALECWDTQVSDLSPLAGLTSLIALHCEGTKVSNLSPLAGLTSLIALHCEGTQVSALSPLSGLTNLQELDCSDTQVTKEEVAKLKKALPNCRIIHD